MTTNLETAAAALLKHCADTTLDCGPNFEHGYKSSDLSPLLAALKAAMEPTPKGGVSADWETTARRWSNELMDQCRSMTVSPDTHVEHATLWAMSAVMDLFGTFYVAATGQSFDDLLAMVPKVWQDSAGVYKRALTRLVREKYLRSYTERGTRYYELNLS
jgi:hypothetical protein